MQADSRVASLPNDAPIRPADVLGG